MENEITIVPMKDGVSLTGEQIVPPEELSDVDIEKIRTHLMVPNERAIESMAREIRKRRGILNPDEI